VRSNRINAAPAAVDGDNGGRMSLGRPYRTIWTAAAISNLGDGVVIAAVPMRAQAES
jgi:hypothetical protein